MHAITFFQGAGGDALLITLRYDSSSNSSIVILSYSSPITVDDLRYHTAHPGLVESLIRFLPTPQQQD